MYPQINRYIIISKEDLLNSYIIKNVLNVFFFKFFSWHKQTDDEWDAILGGLSVLESQFDNELYSNLGKTQGNATTNHNETQKVICNRNVINIVNINLIIHCVVYGYFKFTRILLINFIGTV